MKSFMKHMILSALLLSAAKSYSQNEVDALRYSYLTPFGSSRYNAMGGAFGAVGADASVISHNPAGIGRYRFSSISAGFGLNDNSVTSFYDGMNATDGNVNAMMNHIGMVGVIEIPEDVFSRWKRVQFGFSFNRMADFSGERLITGTSQNSLLDVFVNQANGISENILIDQLPFTAGPAYWAFLIDPLDTSMNTYSHQMENTDVQQVKTMDRSGRINETSFSLGANFDDILYVGGSIGVVGLRYQETASYTETALTNDTTQQLFDWRFQEELNVTSMGVNAKIGVIFLPKDFIRIGFAAHSPTRYFSVDDQYSTVTSSSFYAGDGYTEPSPLNVFRYGLRTPGRLIGSLAVILFKKGLISAEYEHINYGSMSFFPGRENLYSFFDENDAINALYGSAGNIRLGTEWKLGPVYLRGGMVLMGSPFTDSDQMETTIYSGGLGYRKNQYFIDLSYQLMQSNADYYLYDPSLVNTAQLDITRSTISLSLGFKFH